MVFSSLVVFAGTELADIRQGGAVLIRGCSRQDAQFGYVHILGR